MCSGSKSGLFPSNIMEGELKKQEDGDLPRCSVLLELAASNDVMAFKTEVEVKGFYVDEASFWYCRRIGSKKMGFQKRTPLMIAALYGSVEVLKYIVETNKVNVNRTCSADRVTALHCAVAGGAASLGVIVKLLLDASADVNCVDADGNTPVDLLAALSRGPRGKLIKLLKGEIVNNGEEEEVKTTMPQLLKEGSEKKEYPIDVSLPDINDGVYGTDEFRMYAFKVKPCSRAYSHDWTECPFAHPGENAKRRDPRKYPYSCVPCPEFRKGSCPKGDVCDYAHGVFESWLHPSQYRTRLCKDEIGCARKVCFFAHKHEELRPVYASTGSAIPSPRSISGSGMDMSPMMSPLSLVSSSSAMPTTSTPPMSPRVVSSSAMNVGLWQNNVNLTPPSLQLASSRLRTSFNARDFDVEMELLGLDNQASQLRRHHQQQQQQQQQLYNEISSLSSYNRVVELKPTNLDDAFGSIGSSMLSPSLTPTRMQSPTGLQIRQNVNQLRASYPTSVSSSPARKPSSFGFDTSSAVAAAVMNSRSSAFSKRSQSFIDRGTAVTTRAGLTATANNTSSMMSSNLSDWGSPNGKLDWGTQEDDLNRFRRSASFGFRGNNPAPPATTTGLMKSNDDEPDVSWVNSLVKDTNPVRRGQFGVEKQQHNYSKGLYEKLPPWVEQMYIDQEQMVA